VTIEAKTSLIDIVTPDDILKCAKKQVDHAFRGLEVERSDGFNMWATMKPKDDTGDSIYVGISVLSGSDGKMNFVGNYLEEVMLKALSDMDVQQTMIEMLGEPDGETTT
jgi:hypothetical protein